MARDGPTNQIHPLTCNLQSPHQARLKMSFSPATDLTGWRLSVANGRQTWSYAAEKEDRERAQSFLEAVALGLEVSHFS